MSTKDSPNSVAQLIMQAFKELKEEEQFKQKKKYNKRKSNRPKPNQVIVQKNKKRKLNDSAKVNDTDSDSDSDSDIDFDDDNDSDSDSDIDIHVNNDDNEKKLEEFVVSLLKFAPKQRMLVSELTMKIVDTFDQSIKQICNLKTRDFFDKMKQNQIIKLKTKQTKDSSLSFAYLIKNKNKMNNVKSIKSVQSNTSIDSNASIKVTDDDHKEDNKPKQMEKPKQIKKFKEIENKTNKNDDVMTSEEAAKIIRNSILINFLNKSREKIMLSSINAYCYKYTRVQWKKLMIQTPKEFVDDLVMDGLVIKLIERKKGSPYPFIKLNKQNKLVQSLTIQSLQNEINQIKSKYNMDITEKEQMTKQKKVKKTKKNVNRDIICDLILNKFKNGDCKKVFVSTINGLVLNHFEKPWKSVMDCSIQQFVDDMIKRKLVTMKYIDDEQYLVIYDNDQSKKRKLEENDEDVQEPKRKKQKTNDNETVNGNERVNGNKIVLPSIKLNKENGMEVAQSMIEKFKNLERDHEVHFHFQFE